MFKYLLFSHKIESDTQKCSFLQDLLDNKANNIHQFGFTFLIHLYDVISFPNKLVFVELIFEALSFLVIFQII